MIGVVFDITERKELERERLELSGRLIHAQERERAHLAREIHDDFCQRFALLTLKLQTLAHGTAGPEAGSTLRELADTAAALGDDIRQFSHRLHSSKLEVLGLVPGSASLCAAFAKEHGVRIDFDDADIPDELPSAVSLCLFRILQESLRNIVKHSHASRAEVRLSADAHVISMCVFDDGVGFDSNAMRESDGIGIVSMKERARLCDGRCLVQSRPAVPGTRIEVIIPLAVKLLAS